MNVKLYYTGGPLDGEVHEIESSPVSDTPDIQFADYTITPVISIRPDEELGVRLTRGTYKFVERDDEHGLHYAWVT
jgi:hypothetical protein